MPNRIRIIRHEAVPDCGSFEVRFGDGLDRSFSTGTTFRPDDCGPRSPTSVVALMQAKAFARAMSDKDDAR